MATYYVDPYTKYYDKLNSASDMSSNATSIASGMTESRAIIQGLNSTVSTSNWNELGLQQISQNIFPAMMEYGETISNNIENVLKAAADKATGELLPEVKKLKEEDEKLDELKNELSSLSAPSQYDSDGKTNPAYTTYLNKKNELETKINESKTKCEEYKANCDSIANAIKAMDANIEEKEFNNGSSSGTEQVDANLDQSASIVGSVEGGKMIKINVGGHEFYVANTRISVTDYEKYINKVGLTQNAGFMGSLCSTLSQVYACDLMRGTYTARSDDAVSAQSPCTRVGATCESTNEDDIKKYLFDEISAGRVCTLQATQVMTNVNGSRHVVTVVGYDSSVKSYKDLNPDTILVLDCVDGKIQTLSGYERTDGKGHNRKLYAMGNSKGQRTYLAHGATEAFLSKEVNNAEWQAKHGQGTTTVTA